MPSGHLGKRVSVHVHQMHVALPVMVGTGVFSNILFIFLLFLYTASLLYQIFGFDVKKRGRCVLKIPSTSHGLLSKGFQKDLYTFLDLRSPSDGLTMESL